MFNHSCLSNLTMCLIKTNSSSLISTTDNIDKINYIDNIDKKNLFLSLNLADIQAYRIF